MVHFLAAIVLVLAFAPCFAQTQQPEEDTSDTHVIAVVLGKNITGKEKDNLNGLIFGALRAICKGQQD
jgi:hypothetical protein